MKTQTLVNIQKCCTLFVGIGAVWGCVMMLIDPSGRMWGMEPLLPLMQGLPWAEIFFTNFIFSGIVLLCVNGITQLGAAYLIFKQSVWAPLACVVCGVILMLWIVLEWVLWGFNALCNIYFVVGLVQTIFGVLWMQKMKRVDVNGAKGVEKE